MLNNIVDQKEKIPEAMDIAGELTEMENDLKQNIQGDFFKKMKRLSGNKVTLQTPS